MSMKRTERAALGRFLTDVARELDATLPSDLDPQSAAFVRQVVAAERMVTALDGQEAAARDRVWRGVMQQVADQRPERQADRIVRRFRSNRLYTARVALVLILALTALGISVRWVARPQSVSAQVVLRRMEAALTDPAAMKVTSFHFTETITYPPFFHFPTVQGSPESAVNLPALSGQQEIWLAPSHHLRSEGSNLASDGTVQQYLSVSDGATTWMATIDGSGTHVLVNTVSSSAPDWDFSTFFGGSVANLTQLVDQVRTSGCRTVDLRGQEMIAGRSAYIVDIGANTCGAHPTIAPSSFGIFDTFDGRQVLWVDAETFFPLKMQQYGPNGTAGLGYTMTSIAYNPTLPDGLFTYIPPPGAEVRDRRILRPTGTPTATP